MTDTAQITGPAWADRTFRPKAGRFPLAVEAHVLHMTALLVPGVTTVTTNARYYALHGLLAHEADSRNLDREAALDMTRRCEVVFALAAARQGDGVATRPHGIDALVRNTAGADVFDIASLAQPGTAGYSTVKSGFTAPYVGSEITVGILDAEDASKPGPRFDNHVCRDGLGSVLELAANDVVTAQELDAATALTLDPIDQPDGPWLLDLFTGKDATSTGEIAKTDNARRETIAELITAVGHHPHLRFNDAFIQHIIGDSPIGTDGGQVAPWQGTILRWYTIGAWRRLWQWLVDQIHELMPISDLADALADQLPAVSTKQFIDELPARIAGNQLLPAEHELADHAGPASDLRILLTSGIRSTELSARVREAFVGRQTVLGPVWINDRMTDFLDAPIQDFARWLAEQLIQRSQRIAMKKAELNATTGELVLPTRVHVVDDQVYRDSTEGGGDVGLRITQLGGMLASLGVFERAEDAWRLTELAEDIK